MSRGLRDRSSRALMGGPFSIFLLTNQVFKVSDVEPLLQPRDSCGETSIYL